MYEFCRDVEDYFRERDAIEERVEAREITQDQANRLLAVLDEEKFDRYRSSRDREEYFLQIYGGL